MRDIRVRDERTQAMFAPLKETVTLLKQYGVPVKDETVSQLEDGPGRWKAVDKKKKQRTEALNAKVRPRAAPLRYRCCACSSMREPAARRMLVLQCKLSCLRCARRRVYGPRCQVECCPIVWVHVTATALPLKAALRAGHRRAAGRAAALGRVPEERGPVRRPLCRHRALPRQGARRTRLHCLRLGQPRREGASTSSNYLLALRSLGMLASTWGWTTART